MDGPVAECLGWNTWQRGGKRKDRKGRTRLYSLDEGNRIPQRLVIGRFDADTGRPVIGVACTRKENCTGDRESAKEIEINTQGQGERVREWERERNEEREAMGIVAR